ncbi:MAG: hypothetical protein ACYCX4_15035 [Bacillota bacterium]
MTEKDVKKGKTFAREHLGSATNTKLDGKSEFEGWVTENGVKGNISRSALSDDYTTSGPPWGMGESLKKMCEEVGVDFDQFIAGLDGDKSNADLANQFAVKEATIGHLRDHFERKGIDSVSGQD